MAKMKAEKLLTLFEELADKMDIHIVQGKGDFQGGMCSVNEEAYIVLNKIKPIDLRLSILAREFGKIDLGNVFVQPVLRAYIDDIQQDIF
ncbi:hypothetical protein JYT44_01710 [Caldithrix abyssi]|nr:hypothetical protein [Caldithrix abyssi]